MDDEDFNFDLSSINDTGFAPTQDIQIPQSDMNVPNPTGDLYAGAYGDSSNPYNSGGFNVSGAGSLISALAGGGSGGGASGSGGSSLLQTLMSLGSGIYGMTQSNALENMAKAAIGQSDPFGSQRPQYQQQLAALMQNPNAIFSDPGFKATLDQGSTAVARQMAAGGYNGSGNEAVALQQFGQGAAQNYLAQQEQILGGFAGAGISPNPAPGLSAFNAGINQASGALGSLGYGVTRAGGSAFGTPVNPSAAGGEAAAGSGILGDIGLASSAERLISQTGVFGGATGGLNSVAGAAGSLLGIYGGLQQGGVVGDTRAAVGVAGLATKAGMLGGASGALGTAIPIVGDALAIYNFAQTGTKSGRTGSDALQGAETGAEVGSAFGPIGTVVGGVIGGVVGGIASAFGPGAEDPENISWNNYAAAFDKNSASVQGASPSQNYQSLAGIFDSRGSKIPFYNTFGRMGESKFLASMTQQINGALASGTITKADSAQTVYNKVVGPWVTAMGPWPDTSTVKGAPEKGAVQNLLTNLTQEYIGGQGNQWTGVDGSRPQVQPFGSAATPIKPATQVPRPVMYSANQGLAALAQRAA